MLQSVLTVAAIFVLGFAFIGACFQVSGWVGKMFGRVAFRRVVAFGLFLYLKRSAYWLALISGWFAVFSLLVEVLGWHVGTVLSDVAWTAFIVGLSLRFLAGIGEGVGSVPR